MKTKINLFALLIAAFLTQLTFAQKEFTLLYKSEFPISVKSRGISPSRDFCWGTDWKNFSMMDAKTGKILWTYNMKDKFGIKKADSYEWHDANNVLEIKITDGGTTKSYYVEAVSGKIVEATTNTNESQGTTSSSSFKPKKRYIGKLKKDGSTIDLSYKKKLLTGSIKPAETTATVTSIGKNNWQQTFNIKVVRSLFPSDGWFGGDDFLTMYEASGKLFVLYEGLTVLDLKTGNKLWESSFDNSTFDFGLFKSTQELERAAWPLVDGDFVYIVDLSKGNRCIKKVNIENGSVIWKTQEKLDDDEVIPNIFVSGNILFAQFGGLIEKQIMINGDKGTTYKKEYRYAGDFGVKAYDINTGKLLWDTHSRESDLDDKFKSKITNIFTDSGKLYAGSTKNIFCFEANSGKVLFKTPVKEIKLDDPLSIWIYKDNNLIVECEKGVASIDKNSGKVNYATKTGKCLETFSVGNVFYVWTGKDYENTEEFVRFNIDNGSITGKMEDTPYPNFTEDGNEFIKFHGEKVFRYKTN